MSTRMQVTEGSAGSPSVPPAALRAPAEAFGPGRWQVAFGSRRPLLLPAAPRHIQRVCIEHLAGGRLRRWAAHFLFGLQAAIPGRKLLPEICVDATRRCIGTRLDTAHAGLCLGTAGPHQKACALLLSEAGEVLGVAKLGIDPTTDRMVECEAQWLRRLAAFRELQGHVPCLLEEGETRDRHRYLVTSVAPGRDTPRAWTAGHARFLARLGRVRLHVDDFERSRCAERLQQALRRLGTWVDAQALEDLRDAYRECEEVLLYWTGPYVLAQGDFAPWNTRAQGSRLFVFDWEYARPGANPLQDILHFLLVSRAVSLLPSGVAFMRDVLARVREFAQAAYPEWRWRPRVVAALAVVYLLGVVLDYSLASQRLDRSDRVVASYLGLLQRRHAWMAA